MSASRKFTPLTDDFFRPNDRPPQPNPNPPPPTTMNQPLELLNRCFDDIEQFVNRLQRAAEAIKGPSNGSRPNSINGSDNRQYQAPPAKDFIIVFQKFKLAINLLAKLKGRIQDPDAPELVHVIFGPLQLVAEASRDNDTGSLALANRVATPLFTSAAIALLTECLTFQEMRLWKSFGNAWNTPRENWPGEIQTYVPIFSDGWTPPATWLDEDRREFQRDPAPLHREPPPPMMRQMPTQPPPPIRSNSSNNVPAVTQNEDQTRRAKALSVPPPPLVVDDVPVILPPQSQEEIQQKFLMSLRSRGIKIYTVQLDKVAENDNELTVKKGEIVEVLDSTRNWWKVRNAVGETGFCPSSILKLGVSSESVSENNWDEIGSATDFFDKEISSVSGGYDYDAYLYDLRPDHRQRTAVDDMNDEFKQRCVIGKAVAPVRKPPPIAPKPTILLNENSPPEEINQWLNSKGFSYKVQQVFATHNGRQLFQMSKATIERICGYDEGTRLYSQILVQKNRSGYKTIRSQELLGILQARRAKTEETEEDYLDTEYY